MASSMARVASIDIGTNSVRMLVAELESPGRLRRLFGDRSILRLGQGIQGSGMLSEEAMTRAVETVRGFVERARALGATRVLAAATSAVREARNREVFLERMEALAGVRARILTGEQEALWTMEGIRWVWQDPPSRWLAADVGGGSTELVMAQGEAVSSVCSVPLGMVRLTEEFLCEDPPGTMALEGCRARARELLGIALSSLGFEAKANLPMVGTAGTVTTLAALELGMKDYDGDAIHSMRLEGSAVEKWSRSLSEMDSRARRALPGMEHGREDVIVAGAIIVEELLHLVGAGSLVVSDHGLLEGMARLVPRYGQPL